MKKKGRLSLKKSIWLKDDPEKNISRLLWQETFRLHPYKYPVIGYRELFLKLKGGDLLKYYKRMYRPDNMTLIMVGDFNKEDALKKTRELFSNFKPEPAKLIYVPS